MQKGAQLKKKKKKNAFQQDQLPIYGAIHLCSQLADL